MGDGILRHLYMEVINGGDLEEEEEEGRKEKTDLETCSQRGALGLASLKATSISDLILSKAIVSSRGHRLDDDESALYPSETATPPPPESPASRFSSMGFSGKVGTSSISFHRINYS